MHAYLRGGCASVIVGLFIFCGCSSRPVSRVGADARPRSQSEKPLQLVSMPSGTQDLRVMSFNLRLATLIDLINHWGLRKELLVETVRRFDPDLLGTQEGLRSQTDYLRRQLSDYEFFGVGRNNGKRSGEMCGVFFRKSRFERTDGGHFWLSRKPEKPGSKGWGAPFPRMVTWVRLQPRDRSQAFYLFNTHFEAFSGRARSESAKLLKQRIAAIAKGAPSIVTGDFNAGEGSDPYKTLVSTSLGGGLTDTYRAVHPAPRKTDEGTRHGFRGSRRGQRIDWILASRQFQTLDADINHHRDGRRYPSDHFPVQATLRLNAPTRLVEIE